MAKKASSSCHSMERMEKVYGLYYHHYSPTSPSRYHLLLHPLFSSHKYPKYSLFKSPRRSPRSPRPNKHLMASLFFLLLFLLLLSSFSLFALTVPPPSPFVPAPAPSHGVPPNATDEEREFWRQPGPAGYEPCIEFSLPYRRASATIVREEGRFLVAEVNGGLNQQRNQIVDAVVIARILGAALVLPVLQVNAIWGDQSKFSDIFDADHFKSVLRTDVRIVSSVPSNHLMKRHAVEGSIPYCASPLWFRTRLLRKLKKHRVLVLDGLDSKLSKDLPLDLQRLRCKVAFHALRFATPIRELGERLARKAWKNGPYIAVHLRLEPDVWVRTGCLPGLGPEFDDMIFKERAAHPELLTGRLNITHDRRRQAGLCPLNAREVARLLRALGAPRSAQVYWAGGEPLGGDRALEPLKSEFPNLIRKENLAVDGELAPYINRSSALAALDFVVAASSEVFVPSHGGNMGLAIQGHRAYAGHRKSIRPNKRAVVQLMERSLSEEDFRRGVRMAHRGMMGEPEERGRRQGRSVTAYPVPECMCVQRHRFSVLDAGLDKWNQLSGA